MARLGFTPRRFYGIGASGFALLLGLATPAAAQGTLNVLTWCDHEDPTLLQPFETANDVKVNFKDIGSTADALAILGQSKPGDWDAIVMDETDTGRLEGMGLLAPLNKADYPFATIPSQLQDPSLTSVNGSLYSVPEKFGYNTLAYNKANVDPAAMQDINAPWQPQYKSRVAVYDYYVPEIQYAALALGLNPETISDADLPKIKAKLEALKANAAMVGDVTSTQQALTTGAVDILVGGGEWVTAGIAKDQPNLDFTIPKQGGIRWQQGLAVFANSNRKPMAVKFIQYILSPEGQARLATSACYWGMPASTAAALTPDQKEILRWKDQPDYLKASYTYLKMTPEMDKKLQALWAQVMQGK
ncbi:spermidine/putrescine ABC transporter substrate-binding protein [Acidisoma cellulosilytica]|uniref:Spermidine/putrescine ABC transporter substrate-binding protein n=1 Tax=Acidisoma cellulosilyticum TaxID=2802395 RepID=A0A963Z3H8_9PROT|nr:spermidine/putrescine ABC transporter substrate-binding protein [Acidisoma cellulosilyticum]MCB8882115.1 spermidine/putrescine ABC transporter substrate-binding protein [Acidisoma cellulosilyticum]